jgi:hypothetical protein
MEKVFEGMGNSVEMTEEEFWRSCGYEDGLAAGRSNMLESKPSFVLREARLSLGHDLLDGVYKLVWRSVTEFPSVACGAAWSSGVQAGAYEAGARIGYQTFSDTNNLVYIFVTSGIGAAPLN